MPTVYFGPGQLAFNGLQTDGFARIYQVSPDRWEGEFLRGDPEVLWKMFGEVATLTLERPSTCMVMVQSYGESSVSLVGSGPWPC